MKQWVNRTAHAVQTVLSVATILVAWPLCLSWQNGDRSNAALAFLIAWSLQIPGTVIHEVGHCIGARFAGMTVWLVDIWGIEFHSQRRGWRVRLSRAKPRRASGYVMAFPRLDGPIRSQKIKLLVGGPLANVVLAALCGALGLVLQPRGLCYLIWAFAIINLGMALTTLVPRKGRIASDGLQLFTWLRGVDECSPELVGTRLISRSIAGQTAEELPESELRTIEQQGDPMPLVALWYRLRTLGTGHDGH